MGVALWGTSMKSGLIAWFAMPIAAMSGQAVAQDAPASADTAATAAEAPAPVAVSYEIPDPGTLTMPALAFTPTPEILDDYKKYFYFHRADTSFGEAYADIRECDALSSGSNIYLGANSGQTAAAMTQYGALAGGVGSVIGSAIADAIFGSAARREQRRVNLRNCMGFKGYQRFGLSGALWKEFNFEEGMGRKKEDVRDDALALQALVASGPRPDAQELGL